MWAYFLYDLGHSWHRTFHLLAGGVTQVFISAIVTVLGGFYAYRKSGPNEARQWFTWVWYGLKSYIDIWLLVFGISFLFFVPAHLYDEDRTKTQKLVDAEKSAGVIYEGDTSLQLFFTATSLKPVATSSSNINHWYSMKWNGIPNAWVIMIIFDKDVDVSSKAIHVYGFTPQVPGSLLVEMAGTRGVYIAINQDLPPNCLLDIKLESIVPPSPAKQP